MARALVKENVSEAFKKAIFIITSVLIVFIALRNSIIWHLEEFWGGSKSLWTSLWGFIYHLFGENDTYMFTIGSTLYPFLVYVLANLGFCLWWTLTGKTPGPFTNKTDPEGQEYTVNWEQYKKALKRCALNGLGVGTVFNICMLPIYRRTVTCGYELPSFPTTLWHLFVYMLIEELGFYYSHRLLHHRRVYRYIHKTHHEWNAPVSITSIYCHPVEHVLSNTLPLVAGPIVMGSHLSVAWLWFTMAVMNTTISHSGYHLPFLPSPEAHDFHHEMFNQNYGVLGILDRLHGYRRVVQTQQELRSARLHHQLCTCQGCCLRQ
eukprot:Em0022g289a